MTAAPATLDRIRRHLVGLRMPRSLEVLEHLLRGLERGEISALEAIDGLLDEELSLRKGRRVKAALKMGRLLNIKTLAGFDFSFQPLLDRNRILTLAGLDFIDRHEVVHFLGQSPPRCSTAFCTTPSSCASRAPATASAVMPTCCPTAAGHARCSSPIPHHAAAAGRRRCVPRSSPA
jgi:hypothetical protein